MKRIALLAICVLFTSCLPPRVSPEKLERQYRAHAAQKLNTLYYMGSDEHDHYFHHLRLSMKKSVYRVAKKDLPLIGSEFELTDDQTQWQTYIISPVDGIGCQTIAHPPNWLETPSNQRDPTIPGVPFK